MSDAATPALSPLRQQIAEAIHKVGACQDFYSGADCSANEHMDQADAVVALLNLTEERQREQRPGTAGGVGYAVITAHRYVTPWLPSTSPDTSSSETA